MKDFKSFSFISNTNPKNQELLNSPKVEELLFHQWENYHTLKNEIPGPNYPLLYSKIQLNQSLNTENTLAQKTITTSSDVLGKQSVLSLKRFLSIAAILTGIILGGAFFAYLLGLNPFGKERKMTVFSAAGQRTVFSLPDGTKVWLNADSRLEYPAKFSGNVRLVKLTGEAFFDVIKDPKKPFIVEASLISIKVLGTKFNVKSYPLEKTIETTLESGVVSLQKCGSNNDSKPLIIKPQQKATFTIHDQNFKLETVNSELITSWREGKLIFDNELMDDVLKKIERHYGLHIFLTSGKHDDRITLTIKDETIDDVLRLIQLTTPVSFTVENADGSGKRVFHYRDN